MKPCSEITWDDYVRQGRRKYRWGRFKTRARLLFKPTLRRKVNYAVSNAPPLPAATLRAILEKMRKDCEDERRITRRDRRIRRRLPPWTGIKVCQRISLADKKGGLALIQRHWPHHDMPVWTVTKLGFRRWQPILKEKYLEKMKLHLTEEVW